MAVRTNTMDQIHVHPLVSTFFDHYQIESLREKVDFFLYFVENHSEAGSQEAEDLVRRIAVVANVAEKVIEVRAAHRIRGGSTGEIPCYLPHLQKRIEDMNSIKEKLIKVKEEKGFKDWQPTYSMAPASSSPPPATANTTAMVGFDGHLEQLLDQLTGHNFGRQILPIVGMGGIGKTTLAKNVYENLLIVQHFDVRVWVTVSQEFSAREILLQALSCLGGSTSKMDGTDDKLGEDIYKILLGRRYLIVLDDVWSVEAWEKIMFYFPKNNNGSRIVITTRQSQVVDYFGSSALAMDFLDDKNSWDLFCKKTFAQKKCPPELVEIGKKIVKKCKGLPLAIVVIGGLLGKVSTTRGYWLRISKDISLILNSGGGNKISSILSLSYKHLPVWLKTCFLYLGLFPEDHKIVVAQLIKLWIAEGFIKSNTDRSLEEVAESYIKDLVDRNLILVSQLRLNKKFGACYVHDLVRDLSIRIGEKENFFCVQRDIDGTHQYIVGERTARFYPQQSHTTETPSLIRPLIFHGQSVAPFKSRLLRVIRDIGGLDHTCGEVNLRFLYHEPYNAGYDSTPTCNLPSSISLLWSLQTLIVRECKVVAPCEIWKMPQLRHIQISPIFLLDPPPSDDVFVLQNLQTLETVRNLILTDEVCKRIPNIKELSIDYECDDQGEASPSYHLHNVGCFFNKLESLRYSCYMYDYSCVQNLKLPSSLKELTLHNSNFVWSDMAMIGSLPHLEILRLQSKSVIAPEWDFSEEEFLCLKLLQIHGCDDLIKWNADSSNFPVLETLSLVSLPQLEEIPLDIGEIPTLERIEMSNCSESATVSAVKILDEQESLGNQGLRLALQFFTKTEAEMWREKIGELGFTCQNHQISSEQSFAYYRTEKQRRELTRRERTYI